MSKKKWKLDALLALIEKHGPVSPNRLAELSGDMRQSIDKYVRQAHLAELIHVDSYGPNPNGNGGKDVKLWVIGRRVDAKRQYFEDKRRAKYIEGLREKRLVLVKCRRDPSVESIFGEAA